MVIFGLMHARSHGSVIILLESSFAKMAVQHLNWSTESDFGPRWYNNFQAAYYYMHLKPAERQVRCLKCSIWPFIVNVMSSKKSKKLTFGWAEWEHITKAWNT